MDRKISKEKRWDEQSRKKIAATRKRKRTNERTKSWIVRVILKYFRLYCEHSSLHGIQYLAGSQKPWWDR